MIKFKNSGVLLKFLGERKSDQPTGTFYYDGIAFPRFSRGPDRLNIFYLKNGQQLLT